MNDNDDIRVIGKTFDNEETIKENEKVNYSSYVENTPVEHKKEVIQNKNDNKKSTKPLIIFCLVMMAFMLIAGIIVGYLVGEKAGISKGKESIICSNTSSNNSKHNNSGISNEEEEEPSLRGIIGNITNSVNGTTNNITNSISGITNEVDSENTANVISDVIGNIGNIFH